MPEIIKIHKVVYDRLSHAVEFLPDARGEAVVPTIQGKRLVIDNAEPESIQTVSELFGWE